MSKISTKVVFHKVSYLTLHQTLPELVHLEVANTKGEKCFMLLTSCSRWTFWFWISPVYSCWHVQCGDVQLCGDIQLCGYMFSVVTPAIMCWLVQRVVILWWDVVTQGWQFVIILRVCWHVQCGDLCNAVVRCGCPVLAVCNFMSRKCGDMLNVVTCAMWLDVNAQCWQFVIILRVESVVTCSMWWPVQWCGEMWMASVGSLSLF